MKKLIIVLAVLLCLTGVMTAQAGDRDLAVGIIGMATFNSQDVNGEYGTDLSFWENSVWGLTARLKLNDFLGINADFLYLTTKYYGYPVGQYSDPNQWVGPLSAEALVEGYGVDQAWFDANPYYEDKFLFNLNAGAYLPLGFLEPYFQFGPTFAITSPSEEYDNNFIFATVYDEVHKGEDVGIGYNAKVGCDLFLSEGWSVSLAYTMLVPSFTAFMAGIEAAGFDYIQSTGYLTLDVLLWL